MCLLALCTSLYSRCADVGSPAVCMGSNAVVATRIDGSMATLGSLKPSIHCVWRFFFSVGIKFMSIAILIIFMKI